MDDLFNLIEDLDQATASQIIALRDEYWAFQKQKQSLENTIYLEPSKLPESVDAAEKLLLGNQDYIYQRSGKLVRVTKISNASGDKNKLIKRSQDAIIIKEIDQVFLTVYLTRAGNFVSFDARIGNVKKVDCPERIPRYLIAKQEWNIPTLTGIINAPTLRTDGTILDCPGYDAVSGLLFLPGDYTFDKIPEKPILEDAIQAANELLDILKGFPFEDEVSKSVALAAILTALVRKSIETAPLFGFTAPKMASGKSLLADVVALIATGKPNSVIAQAENETEEKKRVLALLIEGDPIICYDNIEKPFKSAALCSILTQREYKDRLLGGNETRTVLTNATFLVTGNNLIFEGDISTRTLLCKLDSQIEHPEERLFDLDLRKYIPQNRSKLVKAGLIILRAYHVAGKPTQNIKPFGRFEEWSDLIRSALVWIGLADPCESRKDIESSDPIRILLTSFFTTWYEIFGSTPVKVKELVRQAGLLSNETDEDHETLREALLELAGDNKDNINQRSLAKKLALYKHRIENGLRLEQCGTHQGTSQWRVRQVKQEKSNT
jgi:putative DNA primase/helicase